MSNSSYLRKIDDFFSSLPRPAVLLIGIAGLSVVALIDFITGFEVSFALFYVVPISFGAWYASQKTAILFSIVSAAAWQEANRLAGQTYASPATPYWNAVTRLGFFLIISMLLSMLKQNLEREQTLSRTDPLTGINNRRAFEEAAVAELARLRRFAHPLTVVYIDLDNFKGVNDRFGHVTGDRLLVVIAKTLVGNLRSTDVVARLGGDEFGLLLPGTDAQAARIIVPKICQDLLEEMRVNQWPVTFSIGVSICLRAPRNVENLTKMADDQMYAAKSKGKNAISYAVYPGSPLPAKSASGPL